MKSFMTTFAAANARRLRIGLAGLAAVMIAATIGISLARVSLFSAPLQQAIPAVSAYTYAALDQHERHAAAIGSAIAPVSYANRDLWYADTAPVAALDQHERHAPTIDQRARATGFYYTSLNAAAAPDSTGLSIDQKARTTGFYYTSLNAGQ